MTSIAVALCASLAPAQTQVHVVDANGGADFTRIADALSAAASGDIVLLKAGDYLASAEGIYPSAGKSVAVVAEANATVRTFNFDLLGLSAGNHVLVQGLTLETTGWP